MMSHCTPQRRRTLRTEMDVSFQKADWLSNRSLGFRACRRGLMVDGVYSGGEDGELCNSIRNSKKTHFHNSISDIHKRL